MLKWSEALYVDPHLKSREERIRSRLDDGKTDLGHYLITLASNGSDQLDVIASGYLTQKRLLERLPLIVGIASSKKEALRLVVRIAEEGMAETGDADIRGFLMGKQTGKEAWK